jgi:hypothetical protein
MAKFLVLNCEAEIPSGLPMGRAKNGASPQKDPMVKGISVYNRIPYAPTYCAACCAVC